ncbi:MAG TPA: cupredoxin domain-containing protein [Gemmatimonadota bacterium]
MRRFTAILSTILVAGLWACGGGGNDEANEADTLAMADTAMPADHDMGAMSTPEWMTVDATARTVTMDIRAGGSDVNNYWNFNGLYAGHGSITVPQGYAVTINFTNADPTQPHSLGIDEAQESWPATFDAPEPAFAGAITADPTVGTAPNGTATLTFTTDAAGEYSMVCYVPGHAVAGMHVPFNVTADGTPGASTM